MQSLYVRVSILWEYLLPGCNTSHRQHQLRHQPSPGALFQMELAAMQPRGALDDRQTQARSAGITACRFQADEWSLRGCALRIGYACTAIRHRNNKLIALLFELHGDFAPAIFDGVIQQVAQRAFQQ